ncbi:hypothetical protein SAMN04488057_101434 [Cyclobacterium lianum]|uniref:Uncharacterized protein n=1 Tax=Cyclobacterium lianum TaxID=388280 RepID=A0A1M7IQW4_9BACT|nr:hypothetical protein [Cyclobacterium lianum]SHM43204.1 hypothetical protein SAMN04488057_101434 [Cyclobacterium lianum]
MNQNKHQILFRLFDSFIPVISIGEKVLLFSVCSYREEMVKRNFQTAVIDTPGGLLKYYKGCEGPAPLTDADIMSASTPLLEAFDKLVEQRRFFLKEGQQISHIVTQSDLDKIPMRLAMMGFISVWETYLRDLVKTDIPDWQQSLSARRMQDAQKLFALKSARNEEIDLIQCLQLADLGSIFSKKQGFKRFLPDGNREEYDNMVRKIGKLRDALAHSQAVLPFSWKEIHLLLAFIRNAIRSV